MVGEKRRHVILTALARTQFLEMRDAMELTGASEATTRRDFAELESAGAVSRYRGGVRGTNEKAGNTLGSEPLAGRRAIREEAKHRIAERAALQVREGDTVFIDAGSTTLALAGRLNSLRLRIVTNSFAVARECLGVGEAEVILTGGSIDRRSEVIVSYGESSVVSDYPVDIAFLGAQGVDTTGVWNSDERLTRLERAVARLASRCVLLADRSKFDVRGTIRVCGLDQIDRLVTDAAPTGELADRLASEGVNVEVAL